MRFVIEAGAELDLATPREIHEIMRGYFDPKPTRRKPRNNGVVPTPTAVFLIDLGSPSQGYRWDVRHVTISGADPTVAFTGSGYVCIGAPELIDKTKVDPFAVWSGATTLPADVSYSKDQAMVEGTEHLYVVISGGTAGTFAVAHAMVFEEPIRTKEVFTA